MPDNMRLCLIIIISLFLATNGFGLPFAAEKTEMYRDRETPLSTSEDIRTMIGSTGGVHIFAKQGELVVEVEKRDLNRTGSVRELRAILVGPDRQLIEEKRIPDDGRSQGSGMGPPQKVTFYTNVEREGVYSLNITVSGARMNSDVVWGFRTNSEHYLVESARGHRDADHEEPIILRNPEVSTDIWFWPADREFEIEITDLPESEEQFSVYDKYGNELQILNTSKGKIYGTISDDITRDNRPWRLFFKSANATIHIDGVTRWSEEDLYQNLSFWSMEADTWFPYQQYRWLLTPYNRNLYTEAADSGTYKFEVHNNSANVQTVDLIPEFPDNKFEVEIVPERISLKGDESAEVEVHYFLPETDEKQIVHIRAKPDESQSFSNYSTLVINPGDPPAKDPVRTPLIPEPYQHENALFGYVPDYPTDWEMYFDLDNRPVVRVDGGLMTMNNGKWVKADFIEKVRSDYPVFENNPFDLNRSNTKFAFDKENDLYHIAITDDRAALLHSADYGRTLTAYDLGESGSFDIENFTGHNVPDGPPAVLRSRMTYHDEEHFWRRIHDLELIIIEKQDGQLKINEPVLLSDVSLGVGTHSGHASAIVSNGARIHIIWGEATDPNNNVPGVPTYVATFNRENGQVEGDPVLIGYGPPPNNVHNRPSITMDSEGYLHALIGTHGQPFLYTRSLEPDDIHSGWTEPEMLAEDAMRQTYIGLVCDPDDTLHLVYRLWRESEEPHPKSHHAALTYQKKSPGSTWSEPQHLILPPFSEYSIFYHRLGIDRQGRLMLSYDYWSTYWFYRNDYRQTAGHYRKTIMSPDHGGTWMLLYTDDL